MQEQLDEVVRIWNAHTIGPSRNENVPSGRPLVMYSVPELYGREDHLIAVDPVVVGLCEEECIFRQYPCEEDIYHLCIEYMLERDIVKPHTPELALDLYLTLRQDMHRDLVNIAL